jgi:glucosyl-3-phosphoglycerate synthase
MLARPEVHFVKTTFTRHGGGRVTEGTAKPLLARLFPELAPFDQPLSGQIGGRRDLLMSLPMATGYAVDVALLISAHRAVGMDGMAQSDLGLLQNRHRPLSDLELMAQEVTCGVLLHAIRESRAPARDGQVAGAERITERPAMRAPTPVQAL